MKGAVGCWKRKLGDGAAGGDAPDLVAPTLHKPEAAIGSGDDLRRSAVGCWKRKLGDGAAGSDAPDLVTIFLGKPQVAIGSAGHPPQGAVGSCESEHGARPTKSRCGDRRC